MSDDLVFIDDDFIDFGCDDLPESDNIDLDPAKILQTANEFKLLFSDESSDLTSSSVAIVIYQNLLASGVQSDICIEDDKSVVTARATSLEYQAVNLLTDIVEDALHSMHAFKSRENAGGFVISSVKNRFIENGYGIEITFNEVGKSSL